jgi:Cu/Ag efflux protein CusF
MRMLPSSVTSCLLAMLLMAACNPSDPPTRRYHVRGQVVAITGEGPERSVTIHHERVPDFVGRDGKKTEMPSMKMIFGVAPEVPSALLKPGAKLGFDFEVRWNEAPALLLLKGEPLGAGVELVLVDEK